MNLKKKEKLKASVVICHWNGGEDVIRCLETIEKQTYKNIETILSDNGSTDGSPEKIKTKFPWVKIIKSGKNLGFAGGNNIGIDQSDGDIVFTINQDLFLKPDYVEKIMNYFSTAPGDIGSAGGKILRLDGKSIDSAGLRLSKARRFFDRGSGEDDRGQYEREEEVFGICAAAAAYRRTMLDAVTENNRGEYFDERFFLLVEDVDLAWRARHCGYKAAYLPSAVCLHARGGADWKNRNKQYLSFRNRYYLIIKNEFGINILLHSSWIFSYDILRFVYLVFTNKLITKALREIRGEWKYLRAERKEILKGSKTTPRKIRRWMK